MTTIKEVHREAKGKIYTICMGVYLSKTHKTVNTKGKHYAVLKKQINFQDRTPDCDKWSCNSVADETYGTWGQKGCLYLSFRKIIFLLEINIKDERYINSVFKVINVFPRFAA